MTIKAAALPTSTPAPTSPTPHVGVSPLSSNDPHVHHLPSPSSLPLSYHPQLHFSSLGPPLSPSATLRVLASTLVIALSSVPICLTLTAATQLSTHPLTLFLISTLVLALLVLLLISLWTSLHSPTSSSPLGRPPSPPPSPPLFLVVFCLFCFSSLIDVWLCVSAHDLHPLASFYLVHGEAYLSSPHGAAINLWDGTFHLACYLLFIHCICRGLPYHTSSIVWCGSILNSMVVLLMGAVIGYGGHLQWSILLNVPYVILPALVMYRRWQQRRVLTEVEPALPLSDPTALPPTVWSGIGGCAVVSVTVLVHCLRACAALSQLLAVGGGSGGGVRKGGELDWSSHLLSSYAVEVEPTLLSPSAFPLLQHLFFCFTSTPLLVMALPHLWPTSPPQSSPPPSASLLFLSLLHVGAILQGHWSYWMQAMLPYTLYSHTSTVERVGEGRWGLGWQGGVALTAVESAIAVGNVWLVWRLMRAAAYSAQHRTSKRE